MGQVTLPTLNRKGFSSVWENQWDSKLNYTLHLNQDMFLKKFFKLFFRNWISHNEMFFNKKIKFKKFIRFSKLNKSVTSKKEVQKYLSNYKNKKFTYNVSKLFLIRYENWLLLYMYIYVPKVWTDRLNKKKQKAYNKSTIEFLYKYQTTKLLFLINK